MLSQNNTCSTVTENLKFIFDNNCMIFDKTVRLCQNISSYPRRKILNVQLSKRVVFSLIPLNHCSANPEFIYWLKCNLNITSYIYINICACVCVADHVAVFSKYINALIFDAKIDLISQGDFIYIGLFFS